MNSAPASRDRILQAAAELFLTAGVEATSVAQICKAAGVSNGSFFHHFPNKDELALEVTLALRRDYWEHLLAALEPNADAMEGIAAVIRAAFAYHHRFPAKYHLSRSDNAPWMRGNSQRVDDDNAPFRARAARWVVKQIEAGKLELLPREIFGAMMFGAAHWVIGNANSDGTPTNLDAVAEDLLRSVQRALSPKR